MGLFGLFTPAWNSKNTAKRLAAVAGIKTDKKTGIQKLRTIADKTSYADVRQEAWTRLALEAASWAYSDLRLVAVEKIDDEITLAKMALHDESGQVRYAAMEKVHHPQLLVQIALSEILALAEASRSYQEIILGMSARLPPGSRLLTEAEYLNKIRGKLDPGIREKAVEKLAAQPVLADVALKDSSAKVRLAAVKKINSQDVLQKVALTDADIGICVLAAGRISDPDVLKDFALQHEKYAVRKAAVEKIKDDNILKEAALKDQNKDVCLAAVNNIGDQTILCEVFEAGNDKIKPAVLERLTGLFCDLPVKTVEQKTMEIVSANFNFRDSKIELIIKKIMDVVQNNPDISKHLFAPLQTKFNQWHEDAKHYDSDHTDKQETTGSFYGDSFSSGWVSGDCVHVDLKEHTDQKHSDVHSGKDYLAKFPPFFKD
ncbi:MAG: hypothetical protein LBM00_02860 [Deltaproteobacteria bacterium]|jgi:hypothetical protein|nr:hypothetical protein [Deltaproteobacteria bacterium]